MSQPTLFTPRDWTSEDVLRALKRASENARQLAEQTGTPFVSRKSAAVANTLSEDFPDDISDDDLGTDSPRHDL
ncbi:MAG: hypothetical protein PHP57_09170 [Sideroxydans sp.]|nr:hypothetical protein [Sideroxydans sp.]